MRQQSGTLSRIAAPALVVPPHMLDQSQLAGVLPRIFRAGTLAAPVVQRMLDRSGVERRFLARPLDETLSADGLGPRNRAYARHAVELGEQAAAAALQRAGVEAEQVDLVISVSCTGYMLPSLDAHLVARLGLRSDVRRLPITELGCVAGAAALSRAADYLRAYPRATVLLAAVEMPSLTFQVADPSPDNLVSALLFGDGAAATVLDTCESRPGCEVLDSASLIAPDTLSEMGFDLRDEGFWVVLSGAVPALLRATLRDFVFPFLARHELNLDDIGFWCVHPGGPKILTATAEALQLSNELAGSRETLRDYGNLSSASIFFVLERLYRQPPTDGALGFLLSFGPGLSMEALLLRWRE